MKITDRRADNKNANRGTARGREAVAKSLQKYGAGRSVLIDRDGRITSGNKNGRAIGDVIIVQSDGTQRIAVQQTDLSADGPMARAIAIADN